MRYTEKYKSILKPCKYCGSTDIHITSNRTIFNPKDVWSVSCANCGDCVYGKSTAKKAVKRWNERCGEKDGVILAKDNGEMIIDGGQIKLGDFSTSKIKTTDIQNTGFEIIDLQKKISTNNLEKYLDINIII